MSLATRCSACGTAFRVVQDQLRVSDGWVRCGQCHEVFNALEGLFDLRAPVIAPAPPAADTPAAAEDMPRVTDDPPVAPHDAAPPPHDTPPEAPPSTPDAPPPDAARPVAGDEPPADARPDPAEDPVAMPAAAHPPAPVHEPAPPHEATPAHEPGLDFDLDLAPAAPLADAPTADAPDGLGPDGPAPSHDALGPMAPPDAAPPDTVGAIDAVDANAVPEPVDDETADNGAAIPPVPRRAVPPGVRLRERARARARAATGADADPPPMAVPLEPPVAADSDAEGGPEDRDLADDPRAGHAPGFVREAERAQRWQRPAVRAVLAGVAAGLVVLAALQAAWLFRDEISARQPALTPALVALCRPLGCTVQAPRALHRLSVEGATLTRLSTDDAAVDGATHRLSVLVRNAAGHRVAAPAIELALSDAAGQSLSRRVLLGAELGTDTARDIAPGGEWPVALALRVDDPRVAGFTVEIFYP